MKSVNDYIKIFIKTFIVATCTILFLLCLFSGYLNSKTVQITVKDKYVKNYNDTSTYIVVDTDNNTYKITDLFFKFKFNSTDIYNNLDVGKKYEVKTTGIRLRLFSTYPNINEIQLLEE